MSAVLSLIAGILLILLIIAANGYFVAQEFAFMSVDRARLAALADQGDKAAARTLQVTKRTSFMLSGAQLGITVTGLLVGLVGGPMVGGALGQLITGDSDNATAVTAATVATLAVATIVQMVIGELYPKNLAVATPEPLAKGLAASTRIYLGLFGWLISFFEWASNGVLRLFGIKPVEDVDATATSDDLTRIVADSRESGDLPEDVSILLDRILDFPERDVEHAMIPRSNVGTVGAEVGVGAIRQMMVTDHSRYPVVSDDEQPLGVVHLADVLDPDIADETPVSEVMREPVVVPTVMMLPDALELLKTSRDEIACVIDEYGVFSGVITIEDLAEELVGEIHDEHDDEPEQLIVETDENTWTMGGDVHLDEVERAIGHDLPAVDVETLGGLLITELGDLPAVGEDVEVVLPVDPREYAEDEQIGRQLHLTVLEIDRFVPSQVRVELIHLTDPDTDQDHEDLSADRPGDRAEYDDDGREVR
ncbi:hemolysin family protein [Corynebacterium heidelbergense]|uniref:HlyC/CorC family transporter n=1 Tax=Corynebacterium heidelbergense TaxID=2055947 RepID=A0A364V842_9CORY|nr:hemolysin family protein [Corynebacterium heidelbergense]RAV32833.1 hypothetical protein DLJ54_01665 [Corynebacterium heidelbergense]